MKRAWLVLLPLMFLAPACSAPVPACGPETCQGCCDATGQCLTSQPSSCGVSGAQCVNCGPFGACILGVCQNPSTGGGGGSSSGGGGGAMTGGGGGAMTGGGGGAMTGGGGGTMTGGGGGSMTGGGGGSMTGGGGGSAGPVTCTAPLLSCNGRCVDTTRDTAACGRCGSSCSSGQLCVNGACINYPPCSATLPCPTGSFCADDGRCLPGCNAAAQCPQPGACDVAGNRCVCANGRHACGSNCVLDDDITACGPNCQTCVPPANGASVCSSGSCDFTCNTGFHRCGSQCLSNTSASSCGNSCTPCSAPANATATCGSGGTCDFTCNTGFHRCGNQCVSNTSVSSCGASSCTPCTAPANATSTCNGTSCDFTCNAGYHRCGNQCVSNTSVNSCGLTSCTACTPPANGTATCNGTSCDFTCGTGTHRCGSTCASNTSINSCGTSCTPCSPPAGAVATCNGTSCDFTCTTTGTHRCGNACVSNTSPMSCGSSCTPCTAPANGTATCDGTSCDFTCNTGYHRCGSACVSDSSTTQCGASCEACATDANGSAACTSGSCNYTCNTGFHACYSQWTYAFTGCKGNTDVTACGSNCEVCPTRPNGSPLCANGACSSTCNSGFRLCGSDCTPTTSASACGSSCTVCPAPADLRRPTCSGTACASDCITTCNGTCVDAQRDEANCGTCGRACAGGETCSAGQCVAACTSGGALETAGTMVFDGVNFGTAWVIAADITGDGRADVITPGGVLVSGPNWSFTPQVINLNAPEAAAGDLNGDGRADVVTISNGGLGVSLSTGTTLGAPTFVTAATGAHVALADLNGDARLDAVVLSAASTRLVRTLLNNGTGGFAAPVDLAVPTDVLALAVGTVTNDAIPDVLVLAAGTTSGTHRLLLYAGTGTGTLSTTPVITALTSRGDQLALEDVDRDGKLDVLLTTQAAAHASTSLRWLKGDGAGTFSADTTLFTDVVQGAWTVAPFNADAFRDVVAVRASERGVYPLLSGTGSTYVAGAYSPAGFGAYGISTGDLDADGDRDVVTIGSSYRIEVTRNESGTVSGPVTSNFVTTGGRQVVSSDFTGDGKQDLARVSGTGVELWIGSGSGTFTAGGTYPLTSSATVIPVDEDGTPAKDLLLLNGGTVTLLRGASSGTFTAGWSASVYETVTQAALFDFDADGQKDLVLASARGTSSPYYYSVSWLRRTGANTFDSAVTIGAGAFFAFGDMDNDGRTDLSVIDIYDQYWSVTSRFQTYLNLGNGLWRPQTSFTGPTTFARNARLADLNADGHLDLVYSTNGAVSAVLGDGRGQFSGTLAIGTVSYPVDYAIVDFDRDGFDDVLAPSDASWFTGTLLFRNKGTGTFESRGVATDWNLSAGGFAVGDFDGTGLLDVVMAGDSQYAVFRGRCY